MKDNHSRSIGKTISYRISSFLITSLLVFLFTRNPTISIGVGLADTAVKSIWYYCHERLWNHTDWGKVRA